MKKLKFLIVIFVINIMVINTTKAYGDETVSKEMYLTNSLDFYEGNSESDKEEADSSDNIRPIVSIYGDAYLYFYSGSVYSLNAAVYNTSSKLKWKSSNKDIVTVDSKGNIKTKNPGTAKVYAYIDGAKDYVKIKVYKGNYKLNLSSKTVMKGTSFKLSVKGGCQYASFSLDDNGRNGITDIEQTVGSECTVTAGKSGMQKVIVTVRDYVDDKYVLWQQICSIKVSNKGIKEEVISIASGKKRKVKLHGLENNKEVKLIKWKSSNGKIARVNSEGTVKGISKGKAKITALVTYRNGDAEKYSVNVMVSAPKINRQSIYMTSDAASKKIIVWGTNSFSTIKFRSTNKSVASVTSDGIVTPHRKGTAQIRVSVDGKVMKCNVVVSTPKLKQYNVMLSPNKSAIIRLKGVTKKSRVKYKSNNGAVAKVNSSGKVIAQNYGKTDIIITVDGKKLRFLVEVTPQRAINAVKKAIAIKAVSTYSQENRMMDGFYDCSSLVFKAYDYDSSLLGGSPAWAPTAANMAKHMVETGKVIFYENVNLDDLRPGDLVFQGGSDNGRFMGIYHVEMYCGAERYNFYNIVMVGRPIQ